VSPHLAGLLQLSACYYHVHSGTGRVRKLLDVRGQSVGDDSRVGYIL
jgi:hypothetical protein